MSALTAREWLVEIRAAVVGVGLMIVLMSAMALDPTIKAVQEIGLMMAFGMGLALGWPGGRVHANPRSDKFRAVAWLLADLGSRIALIVAVELLLRHFEWRYAFKARVAIVMMSACFFTYPWMNRQAESCMKAAKYSATYLSLIGILGLIFLAAAFLIGGTLYNLPSILVGSIGVGMVFAAICTCVDIRTGKPNLVLLVLAVGFVVVLALGWPIAGVASIVAAVAYLVVTICLSCAHDSLYPRTHPPRQRDLREACPPTQAHGGKR